MAKEPEDVKPWNIFFHGEKSQERAEVRGKRHPVTVAALPFVPTTYKR